MSQKSDSIENSPGKGFVKRYSTFSTKSNKELENILDYWLIYAVDNAFGGFYGRRDHNNLLIENAPKGIILNTRILWSFSAAGNFYRQTNYLKICQRAYTYLKDKFRDEEYGGVYWMLDYQGIPTNTRKQTYAQAFTIYSLSEYYKYSGDKDALDWALKIFGQIEHVALDRISGGYIECFTRAWKPIADMRLSEKDLNASKTMNTHLHILEAYTTLFEVSKDPTVASALTHLINLLLNNFLAENNHFELFFNNNWISLSSEISFGHDIEASWLLIKAARVLDDKGLLKLTEESAIAIANTFKEEALDSDSGVYNSRDMKTMIMDTDKHWWPQAEAVVGLLYVWQISGNAEYLDVAENIWSFIEKNIMDDTNGEWFFRVNKEGVPYENENKVGPWKCPYHNSRACIEIINLLEDNAVYSEPS